MESVAVWRPFEPQTSLPPIGTRESTQLDFKAKPTTDRFEAAKDVACLANADGGSLLIGAAGGDHLDSYQPLSTDEAREAQRVFDEAVRDRCAPAPLISFAQIGLGDGIVLAVNVWPFPGQLVGVRLKRSEVRCGTAESQQDGAVIFPLRVGTHTRMITPEQIPMFVDPHARRVAILLSQAVGKDVFVFATRYRSEKNTWVETATILAVDLIANSVTMAVGKEPSKTQIVVPLDMIEAACQAQDQWHVFLRGVFKQVHWADDANPGLKGLRLILDPCG